MAASYRKRTTTYNKPGDPPWFLSACDEERILYREQCDEEYYGWYRKMYPRMRYGPPAPLKEGLTGTHYERNRDKFRAYYESNRDKVLAYGREWRKNNPEKAKMSRKESQRRNPDLYASHWRSREKRIRQATPPWCDRKQMARLHRARRAISRAFGVEYHIDHIIPLRGKAVCGLNVPENILIIPAAENVSKSNKYLGHPGALV